MNKAARITIATLTLIIGILLVVIGVLIYQTNSARENLKGNSSPVLSLFVNSTTPDEDGFFINDGNRPTKLSEIDNDSSLDLNTIVSTNDSSPTFSVRGKDLPIGKLKLKAYYAGIGVDLSYGSAGATINSIFENSPAQLAGLQPGELITAVDGKPVQNPMAYIPGKNDLIGLMKEKVVLDVLSGTTSRKVELPRNYRDSVSPNLYIMRPDPSFTVEPMNDYVLIHIEKALEPGLYRFEFSDDQNVVIGDYVGIGPTPLPTSTPLPLPSQKWLFQVE
jgi:hypothetical protein